MANKDNLIKLVAQKLGPDKLKQMVDQVEQTVGNDPDVNPQSIAVIIQQLEFVAEHPEQYKDVMAKAIQSGVIDAQTLPQEFDPTFIAVLLLAFYGLRDRLSQRGNQKPMPMPMQGMEGMPAMARGGLSKAAQHLQSQGRGGDTILAHINPMEAEALRRMGGSGTVNPHTGLAEFKGGLLGAVTKIVKSVAPMVVGVMTGNPWLAASLGAGLGATGGGGLKGAVLGGLGGYLATPGNGLAGTIGGYASKIPGVGSLGLSNEVLGSGILGGASSAATGRNIITGALTAGALSNYGQGLVDKYGNVLPEGMAKNMLTGAQVAANTGQGLKGIATTAGAAGLASLASNLFPDDPLNQAADTVKGAPELNPENGMYNSATGQFDLGDATNTGTYGDGQVGNKLDIPANAGGYASGLAPEAPGALTQVGAAPTAKPAAGFKMADIVPIAMLGGLLGGKTPAQASQAIQQDPALTAQQKEGMLRSLTNYQFDPGMTTFPQQGTPEWDTLMNNLSQGIEQTYATPTLTEQKAKGGKTRRQPQGALSQMSRLSLGAGDGRSDSIEARLSDGEYVIDAETVALLGNGSTKAGAAMLDQMRQGIRQQKGRALAKGKFSPDAKSPLAYMKGGLR